MFFNKSLEHKKRVLKRYDESVLIKTPTHIKSIRKACAITSQIYEMILKNDLKTGKTEIQIAEQIYTYSQTLGADKELAFETIVGSGPNSSLVHSTPTHRVIKKGDVIQFDFGVRVNGYCSDLSRVIYMGKKKKAPQKVKMMMKLVKRLQAEGVQRLERHEELQKIGTWIVDAFKKKKLHFYYMHSLGHGVGLEIHEHPGISPKTKSGFVPRAGMVVTIEPGLYVPSKFGCRIEDTVLVTETGAEILTTATKKLWLERG